MWTKIDPRIRNKQNRIQNTTTRFNLSSPDKELLFNHE